MLGCPLGSIEGHEGSEVHTERTPTGWFLKAATGLRAELKGHQHAVICRVEPGEDREVVQLGCGEASSALCNAAYFPKEDTAYVFRAEGVRIETILKDGHAKGYAILCGGPMSVTVVQDYMRVHRGLPWFEPMDRKRFPTAPAGWCSWYYYYLKVNEGELIQNLEWLADNLKEFGCEWVQIDDGWQGRGDGYGSNRDWFETCDQDFPHGMKWCADRIKAKGMRPGIWCIPFTQSNSETFEREPMLFVRDEDGSSPGELAEELTYEWMPAEERQYEWAGRYFLDPTGEEGKQYMHRLFHMLCQEWGYDYVKIDAQGMMAGFYERHRPRLTDPSLGGERAYRAGLDAMRSEMGRSRFLLNCGAGWSSCGLCDGVRIGGDVALSWEGMQQAIGSTMRWLYLNTLAFYTDPDVVCVRDPLPVEQARLWATMVGITGQLLMASDKMYELPDERVELLRRIFPVADIHPMELYPLDGGQKPSIFDLKVCKPGVGCWDVVALFNWAESELKTFELSPARLGLPLGSWVCLDVWTGELLDAGDGELDLDVPPASCRVIGYWHNEGVPRVVGTNRHLTQGIVDLDKVEWDGEHLRLSGTSHVVAGDPYKVRIFVPERFAIREPELSKVGPIAELVINSKKSRKVHWRVDFQST